jgi:hypothetical protein
LNESVAAVNGLLLDSFCQRGSFLVFLAPGPGGLIGRGLGCTPRAVLELREQLLAFVGPSFAVFDGALNELDPANPLTALLGPFHRQALVFRQPPGAASLPPLLDTLRRWAALRERAPGPSTEPSVVERGSWSDFQMALRALNRPEAERQLAALARSQDLSDTNLLFLRVEMVTAFHAWREVLGLPDLERLVQQRRPLAVTEALLRAFYQAHVARYDAAGRPDLALDAFRAEVLPLAGTLLTTRAGLRHADVRRLFMYWAVHGGNAALRDHLLAESRDEGERTALRAVAALLETPAPQVPSPSPEQAGLAYESGDVDTAFTLLLSLPASFERAVLLLDCADALRTLQACDVALQAVENLPAHECQRLMRVPRLRRTHAGLLDLIAEPTQPAPPPLPGSWPEWFDRLQQPEGLDLEAIARQAVLEWHPEDLDGPAVARLVGELTRPRQPGPLRVLRAALPWFIAFLQRAPESAGNRLLPLYQAVLTLLLVGHDQRPAALSLIHELVHLRLEQGFDDAAEYKLLIDDLTEVWRSVESIRHLGWLLDLAGLVAEYPDRSPPAREQLVRLFTCLRPAMLGGLAAVEWEVLARVCGRLGLQSEYDACRVQVPAEEESDEEKSEPWARLDGLRVGIYSLEKPSARRAAEVIQEHCQGCAVVLNHDLVATGPLREMARSCDVLVMVVRAAQHAATTAIISERGDRPLLRPEGKGASSILRKLLEHARGLPLPGVA